MNKTAGLEHEASHGRRIRSSVMDFWSNCFVIMFLCLVAILRLVVMWDYVRGIERKKARKLQFGSIQHQSIRLNAACGNAGDSLLRAHRPTNNARASRWEMGNGNGQAPWWMWSIMAPLIFEKSWKLDCSFGTQRLKDLVPTDMTCWCCSHATCVVLAAQAPQ